MEYFKNNRWKAAGAGIVVFVMFLVWGYIIPEFQQTLHLYSTLQEKKAEIASVQNWQHRLNRLNEQREKLEEYLSKIFLNLPEDDQMSTIIDQVFKEAESGDVKVIQMRPDERIQHESYLEIPISLQVKGSYHEIGGFVNRIEQSRYLMKVERVNIKSEDIPNKPLNAHIGLKVIILKRNAKEPETNDA